MVWGLKHQPQEPHVPSLAYVQIPPEATFFPLSLCYVSMKRSRNTFVFITISLQCVNLQEFEKHKVKSLSLRMTCLKRYKCKHTVVYWFSSFVVKETQQVILSY